MTTISPKDADDADRSFRKTEVVTGAVAKILIPLLIALVGWWYSSAIKQQEIGATFVQLSIDILEEPPDDRPPGLTEWAMDVVDEYSGVRLGPQAREELKQRPLRFGLELAPEEQHVISVTPTEEGSFSLKDLGSAVIQVERVDASGVAGLRIETSSGTTIESDRAQVGDLFPLKWPNGGEAIVKLKEIKQQTDEAIFSISVRR